MNIPKSYGMTKAWRLVTGMCVQCGKVPVKKYKWCVECRRKVNFNGR